ncbi:MAG: sensor histidine kinase [Chloroflexi bacterium]|nr:sensor histidine kinase [Chloroflexota bacterium]
MSSVRRILPPHVTYGSLVWLVYLAYPIANLVQHSHSPSQTMAGWLGLGLFVLLYVIGFRRQATPAHAGFAVAVGLLGLALTWFVAEAFFGIIIYAASFIAWRSNWQQAVVGLLLLAALHAGLGFAGKLDWNLVLVGVLMDLSVGVSMLGFYRYLRASVQLEKAGKEIERLAALAERERIARDLHDVLGQSLTVITLKSELAARLATSQPDRAAAEMADVESVSRRSLQQLRAVVGAYHSEGLRKELDGAAAALSTAGITCDYLTIPDSVSPLIDGVLALVLREAITNVIRHSRAGHCEVTVETAAGWTTLVVADDGQGIDGAGEGIGLRSMRERVAALGGELQVQSAATGTRVLAHIPLTFASQPARLALAEP